MAWFGIPDESNDQETITTECARTRENYAVLEKILKMAYDQAATGKGHVRHGKNTPFEKQVGQFIQTHCPGFCTGQAIKKIIESGNLEPPDRAIRELLGAINYVAMAIIPLLEKAKYDNRSLFFEKENND